VSLSQLCQGCSSRSFAARLSKLFKKAVGEALISGCRKRSMKVDLGGNLEDSGRGEVADLICTEQGRFYRSKKSQYLYRLKGSSSSENAGNPDSC